MKAMISSAALPKVAFSSPPMPSPVWCANCSVAVPSHPARGMIAKQAAMKIAVWYVGARYCSPTATGTKIRSQLSTSVGFLVQLFLERAGARVHVHGEVRSAGRFAPDDAPDGVRILVDLLQQKGDGLAGILLVVLGAAVLKRRIVRGVGIHFDRDDGERTVHPALAREA